MKKNDGNVRNAEKLYAFTGKTVLTAVTLENKRPPIYAVNLGSIKFKFKTVLQNLPNIACRLTCCHVPLKGFFSLENLVPFRELVRVATRS
jgi:hypothetical protein